MLSELKRLLEAARGENYEYDESDHYEEDPEETKEEEEHEPINTDYPPLPTKITPGDAETEEENAEKAENEMDRNALFAKSEASTPQSFTIDVSKPNVIIVMGFIEQSLIDLFNEQKIRYNDFLSMYSHFYMEEIKNAPNEFIKHEDIEKRAADKVIKQLTEKKGIYILRLYERTFCIQTVMHELAKNKDIEVSFIQYSIPYLFEVYKQRVNVGSTSDIHKWLEIPLTDDFEKKNGKLALQVKADDIIDGCQQCKKFFESEKDLKQFAKKLEGSYVLSFPVSAVYPVSK